MSQIPRATSTTSSATSSSLSREASSVTSGSISGASRKMVKPVSLVTESTGKTSIAAKDGNDDKFEIGEKVIKHSVV